MTVCRSVARCGMGVVGLGLLALAGMASAQVASLESVIYGSDAALGLQGNAASTEPGCCGRQQSADGRYVVFVSAADNLVAADQNLRNDIFLRDTSTGETRMVSVATGGAKGNGNSNSPSISADGRYIAFASDASNLVAGDDNGVSDIFVHDRIAATTVRVSVSGAGVQANNVSNNPAISGNGRYVVYVSAAGNLVAGGNSYYQIYRFDRDTGTVLSVSVDSAGAQVSNHSDSPSLSDDGAIVAFDSAASNLVAGDSNGARDVFVRDLGAGTTVRASVDGSGAQGNGPSERAMISGDGAVVAFESTASNLVAGDGNSRRDVFVRVLAAGTTTRVSVASGGTQANEASSRPSLSLDGRYVAFQSDASNLIAGDSNAVTDVFLHDRNDGSTVRVSIENGGAQANNPSGNPSLSADGALVLFDSTATNLVAASDSNNTSDVYRRDRVGTSTTRISEADASGPFAIAGNGHSSLANYGAPAVSADGRYVAFQSSATNLVPGDSNGVQDIFLFDRVSATLELISIGIAGVPANNASADPVVSGDGRYVAYGSYASNLVAGDSNGQWDVFVRDRTLGTTTRVSVATGGGQGNSASEQPSISIDGRYVAFRSYASNVVAGDSNGSYDVFVHDRDTGTTTRVSVDSLGVQGNSDSDQAEISGDGRYVAFRSNANNLVAGDSNGAYDVFRHDRVTGATIRINVDSGGLQANGQSHEPSLSGDGGKVVFYSLASNLVPGDTNSTWDAFLRDVAAGTTTRVSLSSSGTQGNNSSTTAAISADGSTVAFVSSASNLAPLASNGNQHILVRDLVRNTTTTVSVDTARTIGNNNSFRPALSADGLWVAFDSQASNWVLDRGRNGPSYDVFLAQRLVQEQSTVAIVSDLPDPSVVGYPVTVVVQVTGATVAPTDGRVTVTASTGQTCTDSDGPVAVAGTAEFSCVITFNSAGSRDLTASFSRSATHIDASSAIEFHSVQALPTLAIADVTQAEGTGGSTVYNFTLTRSHNLNPVSVRADTSDNSATAGSDYTAISNQTVSFTAGGALTAVLAVTVAADAVVENNENFNVVLSQLSGATFSDSSALGTISNDDSATLSISDVSQNEGSGSNPSYDFTVTLTGEVAYSFNVPFATANGTAIVWQDYEGAGSSLNFTGSDGQTRTLSVVVYGDFQVEADQTFLVNLSAPNASITLADGQGQGTILNDDAIAIAPASLSNAAVGAWYAQTLSPSNGVAPYAFSLSAGSLPAGLSLSGAGNLSGTPTEAGSFNFTVQVDDQSPPGEGGPFQNTRAYTLLVGPPNISIAPGGLANGLPPLAYSVTLSASGGTAPYGYALASGSLPPGLTLEADGDLVGTPTTPGSYSFSVAATDSSTGAGAPFTATRSYTLVIDNNAPTLSTPIAQSVLEDSAPTTVTVTVGDEETADASLLLSASSSDPSIVPDPTVGAGSGDDQRTVSFAPVANANGGPVTITLTLTDSHGGGNAISFLVSVTPVNDAPTLTLGADIIEAAGTSGFRSRPSFVQSIVLGPADEAATQTLLGYSVAPVSDPNGIVSSANLALNGTLTYTLTGRGGSASFEVVAIDNGGVANGGNPYSAATPFQITVAPGADLQISKSDGQTLVQPGQALLYDIYVANAGPSAVSGARVQDTPPATLGNAIWSCTPILLAQCGSSAGVGAIDETVNLPAGSVLRYTMSATVNATPPAVIDNTATVTVPAGVSELDAANNSDTDTDLLLTDGIYLDGFEQGPNPITVPFVDPER